MAVDPYPYPSQQHALLLIKKRVKSTHRILLAASSCAASMPTVSTATHFSATTMGIADSCTRAVASKRGARRSRRKAAEESVSERFSCCQ